eukprot:CAMPEP_0175476830 /NCGR_PEP_ID=MMETSP0095-20121207/76127_1 /TAXON_ID=311494 /ORGANISM="Alexandrium monilatum, Strain CCMP3105" /LENGTH=292 /DNA_ID=CAMNT_0016778425 /DNA_START=101 /DNA_END=978 /DNA_ORIENTATION=-
MRNQAASWQAARFMRRTQSNAPLQRLRERPKHRPTTSANLKAAAESSWGSLLSAGALSWPGTASLLPSAQVVLQGPRTGSPAGAACSSPDKPEPHGSQGPAALLRQVLARCAQVLPGAQLTPRQAAPVQQWQLVRAAQAHRRRPLRVAKVAPLEQDHGEVADHGEQGLGSLQALLLGEAELLCRPPVEGVDGPQRAVQRPPEVRPPEPVVPQLPQVRRVLQPLVEAPGAVKALGAEPLQQLLILLVGAEVPQPLLLQHVLAHLWTKPLGHQRNARDTDTALWRRPAPGRRYA